MCHKHMHTFTYNYMCICVYVCLYKWSYYLSLRKFGGWCSHGISWLVACTAAFWCNVLSTARRSNHFVFFVQCAFAKRYIVAFFYFFRFYSGYCWRFLSTCQRDECQAMGFVFITCGYICTFVLTNFLI